MHSFVPPCHCVAFFFFFLNCWKILIENLFKCIISELISIWNVSIFSHPLPSMRIVDISVHENGNKRHLAALRVLKYACALRINGAYLRILRSFYTLFFSLFFSYLFLYFNGDGLEILRRRVLQIMDSAWRTERRTLTKERHTISKGEKISLACELRNCLLENDAVSPFNVQHCMWLVDYGDLFSQKDEKLPQAIGQTKHMLLALVGRARRAKLKKHYNRKWKWQIYVYWRGIILYIFFLLVHHHHYWIV